MLDILKRGTVQVGGTAWEYHGDTKDASVFYITPQPVWFIENKLPKIQIVQYETSDELNGSGYCTIEVELGLPDGVVAAVTADIAQRFQIQKPHFLTLPFQSGTLVSLTYPDGQGGTTGAQTDGTDFGSNAAVFQISLSADQMKTIKEAMSKQGGSPFEIQYSIKVAAQMPAVTAVLSFDSAIAFQYQVTSHKHSHWGSHASYTYDIRKQLAESNASKIVITKTDPNLSQEIINRLTVWGQSVIAARVESAVQQAIQIEQSAGGTQSFSVNEVASFNENYQQNEVILWQLQPQAILPSFGDFGLTIEQINSLEPAVDKRKLVTQVTPQCDFVGSSNQALASAIQPSSNPFMTDVKKLKSLDVTVMYPTLSSASDRTHTFTDNRPFTWQTDWDDTAGGVYSLSYVAVYEDGTQVKGSADKIDASAYTLALADIGTLNVTFDASRFFVNEASLVNEVTVDFVFNIPQEPPFLQSATLTANNAQTTFSSVFPAPLTSDYVYTVTYGFVSTAKANAYTSDAKRQNGQWVRLQEPDFQQSFNVFVQISDPKNPNGLTVTEADINFYYDGEPFFPDIPASQQLPSPTQSSPIQLNFPISGSTASSQIQKITVFGNTNATPLTVNATLLTSDFNSVQIGPYQFSPQTVTLIALSPTNQFIFIGADPIIVDWTSQSLQLIHVTIKQVRYNAPGQNGPQPITTGEHLPTRSINFDAATERAYPVFFIVSDLPNGFTDLEFDWRAEYVYKAGSLYASGTERGESLALPKSATDEQPPASDPSQT